MSNTTVPTAAEDVRVSDRLQSIFERLCPLHALLRDAKVNVVVEWIRES